MSVIGWESERRWIGNLLNCPAGQKMQPTTDVVEQFTFIASADDGSSGLARH